MRYAFIALAVFFSQVVLADQAEAPVSDPQPTVNESVLRTNAALKSYNEEYLKKTLHKAFAQSPDGTWNWRGDRITTEMAIEDALASCNRIVRKGQPPCEIVNVDGEWVTPDK